MHGLLIAVMSVLSLLRLSIDIRVVRAVTTPVLARWVPHVWFLGLYQALSGNPDPWFHELARRGLTGLGIAAGTSLLTYLLSYHRHRGLLVEGVAAPARRRRIGRALLERIAADPREQAILVFMFKTLSRSGQHRIVLMGYIGFAAAVALSGIFGVLEVVRPPRIAVACFVYAHVVIAMFAVIGLRHLFAIPVEL